MFNLKPFLLRGTEESSKRLIALTSAWTLCTLTAWLGALVGFQVFAHRAVDPQLATAFIGCAASLAALAGAIGRKPE